MRFLRSFVFISALIFFLLFRARRRIIARSLGLRPPQYGVRITRGIRVPMRDGVTLVADLYSPLVRPASDPDLPTVLIRSPYGRNRSAGWFGLMMGFFAARFAERGYYVLLQDTRGRFDSGGTFNPYMFERQDGFDTVAWLNRQAWYNGALGLWGPSYLGIVQWAIAADVPQVRAMVPSITSSRLFDVLYPDGVLDLGLTMRWLKIFQTLDRYHRKPLWASTRMLFEVENAIAPAFKHLPVTEADQVALGEEVSYFREWVMMRPEDRRRFEEAVNAMRPQAVSVPTHLIGGWYDFFLRTLLSDYATLRAAGQRPYLTIGPWQHFSDGMIMTDTLSIGLNWFDAHLKGDLSQVRRKPVRYLLMGAGEWRECEDWPPPAHQTRFYLGANRTLGSDAPPADVPPDRYRYDPADPTPVVGGAYFSPWGGPRDNRTLEARPDVLTFTSVPLDHALDVVGPVRLDLYAASSLEHTDFFGRLCDVHPDGRSVNVCDGLFRIAPEKGITRSEDGVWCITVDMWATAYRFAPGHCIRLQVSSGAHPRWTRNLGTGDPLGVTMRAADQIIYHDLARPSALVLPVLTG